MIYEYEEWNDIDEQCEGECQYVSSVLKDMSSRMYM